ncbi:MAG: EthD family reductase [Betaproteobacteria bacterium]
MAKVYALYRAPTDAAAFERYYFDKHIPLAKTIPGLRNYEITRRPLAAMAGASPYYMIATLSFDSRAAIDTALVSPQGQAIAADLANFASGGVDVLIADTETV